MNSVPDKLPPTIRRGCSKGTGYANHLLHNEIPCDSCKEGKRNQNKQWLESEAGKKRRKEYVAKYRKDNKEYIKLQIANYYIKNKEKIKDSHHKYYLNNKAHVLQRLQKNKEKNPEIQKKGWRTRRARLKNAESEPYTTQEVLDLYGTVCYLCNEEIDLAAPRSTKELGWERGLHLDHLIPLSKGGSNLKENLRPVHGLCNVRKGSTELGEGLENE